MKKQTEYIKVDPLAPENDTELINKAADILRNGGLVAFPTETVYGLGANAYDEQAVKEIYTAKGRPSDNPLILHIADISGLSEIVGHVPPAAEKLIEAFWPGPLTLVFKKNEKTPTAALRGLTTVGIRLPCNKTARLFLKAAGVPVAAPSANSSGKPSPTRASHVLYDLDGKIDAIIDGGSSEHGLESTIVDVSGNKPCLLRPGSITLPMLTEVVGPVDIDPVVLERPLESLENLESEEIRPKAPGMKYQHYSPVAKVIIVTSNSTDTSTSGVAVSNIAAEISRLATEACKTHPEEKIGILATEQTKDLYKNIPATVLLLGDRDDAQSIAKNLFKLLRKADFLGIDIVFTEGVEESELGLAIMNRLKKASGYSIIHA